jgi:hypothetical protein
MVSVANPNTMSIHRPRGLQIRLKQIPSLDVFFTIPAGFGIDEVFWAEVAGNTITGGLDLGTTDGGADVLAAFAVVGNSMGMVGQGATNPILKSVFSLSVPQLIYVHAHTGWNNAVLNLYFGFMKLNP